MRVEILTRKDRPDERRMVMRIELIIRQAADASRQHVEITLSNDLKQYENSGIDLDKTPIVFFNGVFEFCATIPKVDVVKNTLIKSAELSQLF